MRKLAIIYKTGVLLLCYSIRGFGSASLLCAGEVFNDCLNHDWVHSCFTSSDCKCGFNVTSGICDYGVAECIDESIQCPDFCTGIAGDLVFVCKEQQCLQVKCIDVIEECVFRSRWIVMPALITIEVNDADVMTHMTYRSFSCTSEKPLSIIGLTKVANQFRQTVQYVILVMPSLVTGICDGSCDTVTCRADSCTDTFEICNACPASILP